LHSRLLGFSGKDINIEDTTTIRCNTIHFHAS